MAASVMPSDEQKAIIASSASRLQVIACAGSGKTEAMARRIARLVRDGAPAAGIVAFTFTERAAESLKSRVRERLEDAEGGGCGRASGQVFVGTIHAYCLRLLQQHASGYGNYDLLDEHRLAAFLSREFRRLGLAKCGATHWRAIDAFMQNLNAAENELMPAARLQGSFGECYRDFCDALRRYRLLTYGQIISLAVEALGNPEVLHEARAGLHSLIVDEYQDVNPAQEKLIRLLAAPPVSLCVVGDDDQAIYQWRGSDIANIVSFAHRYRGAIRLPLSTNRRSRPEIIRAANRFVGSIQPRLDKEMVPSRPSSGLLPFCWLAETPTDEAETIADHIVALKKRGYAYRNMGILLRSVRTSAPPFIEALRRREIPFSCGGRTGLFTQPEAQLLGQVYAWLSNNQWKESRYAVSQAVKLKPLLKDLARGFGLSARETAGLSSLLQKWCADASDDAVRANLVGDFYVLLRALQIHRWDLAKPDRVVRMGVLARFASLLADFENVKCRARTVRENGAEVHRGGNPAGLWLYRQLFNYIQFYAVGAYEDFGGEDDPGADAVAILTVHQAKGLEWPIVFLPCLAKNRFPSKNAGREQGWLLTESEFSRAQRTRYEGGDADERRLMYVALTRAREVVYLSTFRRIHHRVAPSPYFREIAGTEPSRAPLPLPAPPENVPESGAPAVALSFSDLALFESCPHSYRLRSLLGFPPQLAQELGYGRAVHSTLRRLSELTRSQGRTPTREEAGRIVAEEFYLPFANRPAFENLKAAASRLVNRYLDKFGAELLRTWDTERPFELTLPAGAVKGRADVILDREAGEAGSLALVDYKTSQASAVPDDMYAFQLAIYAAAARDEDLNVRGAYLHYLADRQRDGDRVPIPVSSSATGDARRRAGELLSGIAARRFDAAPAPSKCESCDMRMICRHRPSR